MIESEGFCWGIEGHNKPGEVPKLGNAIEALLDVHFLSY